MYFDSLQKTQKTGDLIRDSGQFLELERFRTYNLAFSEPHETPRLSHRFRFHKDKTIAIRSSLNGMAGILADATPLVLFKRRKFIGNSSVFRGSESEFSQVSNTSAF